GKTVFAQTLDAPAADRVVPVIGRLAAGLRGAIGDKVPDAEAEQTGVSPVLDADREFAQGDALLKSENDRDGAARLQQAVALDPEFARAHVSLGIAYENLGRPIEARDELARAFALQDRLGERDRLKMLTDYYRFATGEPDRSIAEYRAILAKWPDDFIAE